MVCIKMTTTKTNGNSDYSETTVCNDGHIFVEEVRKIPVGRNVIVCTTDDSIWPEMGTSGKFLCVGYEGVYPKLVIETVTGSHKVFDFREVRKVKSVKVDTEEHTYVREDLN
jgi:hypothetical protein